MALTPEQRKIADDFRDWVAISARQKIPFVGTTRKVDGQGDPPDSLAMRLYTDNRTWLEAAVLPKLSRLRVGLASDSRTRNEEAEQLIQDSKETMDEFLELGLADAGYEEEAHHVDHFHESGVFYFVTHLDLKSIESLADPGVSVKAMHLVEGYALAFEEMLNPDY